MTLRKGVTWTDGKPFVAKDVQFSFERVAARSESQQQHLANWCVPMQIVDDDTNRCNMKEPVATSILLTRMADQGAMTTLRRSPAGRRPSAPSGETRRLRLPDEQDVAAAVLGVSGRRG